MVKRNPFLNILAGSYLFPEVRRRVQVFLEKNPDAQCINLSVGDTSEPLSPSIIQGLTQKIQDLASYEGYSGYGPEEGIWALREKIASVLYKKEFSANEVFVSDGANCDIARLQVLFGSQATVAVQDPSYPVYVDGSIIIGQGSTKYAGIKYLRCSPKNDFFPDLKYNHNLNTDIIYFCSPNNPTGVASSRSQLSELVNFAYKNRSIIIFDAAYSSYIQDPDTPRSIYEIEGAREVAIEVGSFSKMAGFTGVRLGWSVIPQELCYEDGAKVLPDWTRLVTTLFNGASNIAQAGGIAALTPDGLKEIHTQQLHYLENAALLTKSLERLGYPVYGGKDAPFLWVKCGEQDSWRIFEHFLEKYHIITIPGSGFGPGGEGFLRFSAFPRRHQILKAIERLRLL